MDTDDLNSNPGFLHNLPGIYHEAAGGDTLLDQAVMAVAKSYGASISLLNKTLSEDGLNSDTTLIAVLFLNYYSVFSDAKPETDVLNTHSDALSLLLRLRGTASQFLDRRMGGITRAAYHIITYRNMMRRVAPGAEVALMERCMECYKDTPWARSALAWGRITRLLPRCDEILAQPSSAGQASKGLLEVISLVQEEDDRYPER
ncbi:hypothetical protein DL95DRAFT_471688 [Leptodontidium sp. 2 PMI_412]|nr:hypothetical protein DL95DRAFT_471688 [Leptodontidium sp. 2 PMI_412]